MTERKSFEAALKELESVVDTLEHGEMSIEDALKAFENGVGLAQYCSSLLDQAEKRVKLLTENEGSDFRLENWQEDETGPDKK